MITKLVKYNPFFVFGLIGIYLITNFQSGLLDLSHYLTHTVYTEFYSNKNVTHPHPHISQEQQINGQPFFDYGSNHTWLDVVSDVFNNLLDSHKSKQKIPKVDKNKKPQLQTELSYLIIIKPLREKLAVYKLSNHSNFSPEVPEPPPRFSSKI